MPKRRTLAASAWLPLGVIALSWLPQSLAGEDGSRDPISWDVVGKPAVPFTLENLDGGTIQDTDLVGKVVILDFWATWCSPCLKELPELAAYTERIKDRNDVVFLSLNVTDPPEELRSFARQHAIAYPIYSGDELLEPYEVFAFPTKLILDLRTPGTGEIRYRHFGFTGLAGIEDQVAKVLTE